MRDWLALISRGATWRPYSIAVRAAARWGHGLWIPASCRVEGPLKLALRSRTEPSVLVGEDVQFIGGVDLRTRDAGRIKIGSRVKFDGPIRIVAAGDGLISVGDDTRFTPYTIINGGGSIRIGERVVIGPRFSLNANEHRFHDRQRVIESGFSHVDIAIGNDVWIGADVSVLPGADIAEGSVIGANSVVNCPTEPFSIYAGSPARKIGERRD